MRFSFRKLLALLLCAAVVFGGCGITSAFSGELAHELGLERNSDGTPSPCGNEGLLCAHGCTNHVTAHPPALTSLSALALDIDAVAGDVQYEHTLPGYSLTDLLFRPPRFSLA